MCQRGHWASGVDCEIPHRLERETSASKDVGPRRGWIVRSHVDWRGEQVSARMLGSEGGWIVRSHISWRRERNILYKGVETSPYQTRFKNREADGDM